MLYFVALNEIMSETSSSNWKNILVLANPFIEEGYVTSRYAHNSQASMTRDAKTFKMCNRSWAGELLFC